MIIIELCVHEEKVFQAVYDIMGQDTILYDRMQYCRSGYESYDIDGQDKISQVRIRPIRCCRSMNSLSILRWECDLFNWQRNALCYPLNINDHSFQDKMISYRNHRILSSHIIYDIVYDIVCFFCHNRRPAQRWERVLLDRLCLTHPFPCPSSMTKL